MSSVRLNVMISEAKPKKCKNYSDCGNKFTPNRSTDRFCSFNCARILQPMQKVRKMAGIISKVKREPAKRTRMKMLAKQRDHFNCKLAGVEEHECDFRREAHHILYLSEGGVDELWNLITLCGFAHHQIAHKSKKWQAPLLAIVNGTNWYEIIEKNGLKDTVLQKLKFLSET